MTAYEQIESLCNQWERKAKLPPDARHLLHKVVKGIVLEAAHICDRRRIGRPVATANEAQKCGMAIRHYLLCQEGESICLRCDGAGCEHCLQTGIKARPLELKQFYKVGSEDDPANHKF